MYALATTGVLVALLFIVWLIGQTLNAAKKLLNFPTINPDI